MGGGIGSDRPFADYLFERYLAFRVLLDLARVRDVVIFLEGLWQKAPELGLLRCRLPPELIALPLGWPAAPVGWAAAEAEPAPAAAMKAVVVFNISRRLGGKSRPPAALMSMNIINLLLKPPGETCDTTRYSGQRAAWRGGSGRPLGWRLTLTEPRRRGRSARRGRVGAVRRGRGPP
jgi:hypothetical protein